MSTHLTRTVAAVAVASLLAACGGGSDAAEAPAPTASAEVTVAPTETEEPSPEPTERDILTDPENDARDPAEALVAIYAFRDALFTAPDPEKLTLAYAEDCECYEPLRDGMARFSEAGQYAEFGRDRTITDVEVTDRSGPAAVVRFRMDIPPIRLLGPDGAVVEEGPGEEEMSLNEATLVLRGGRWILVDVREVSE